MDVKTFCLGLLCFREACGYDLKKEFENLLRHFYPAGCGSIYPALAALADEGLVECEEIAQEGRPDRKVYRITDAGRASFAESLASMRPQHKLRSEFLAVMYFADLMEPERLEHLLNDRLEELTGTLSQLAAIQNGWGPDTPAGAKFVAGFGAAVAESAARYIEANQHLLVGDREAANAEQPVVPAVAAGHHS